MVQTSMLEKNALTRKNSGDVVNTLRKWGKVNQGADLEHLGSNYQEREREREFITLLQYSLRVEMDLSTYECPMTTVSLTIMLG